MKRVVVCCAALACIFIGSIGIAEATSAKSAALCKRSLPQLYALSDAQIARAREQITGAVPNLFSGDLSLAEKTLIALYPHVKTASFARGSAFLTSLKEHPGVLVIVLEHGRIGRKMLMLQPASAHVETFMKVLPKRYVPHSTGNGFLIEHEGKVLLISNAHVLGEVDPMSVLSLMGSKYELDAAAIEIPQRSVPRSVTPAQLSLKKDEDLTGRPFFIPSIDADTLARGLRSITVTTGFVMPIPALLSDEPTLQTPEHARELYTHGGIHEDCAAVPRRGDIPLELGGFSGSPAYDFRDRDIIGLFFGGSSWRSGAGGVHKITAFVSAEQLTKALKARERFPFHKNIRWAR